MIFHVKYSLVFPWKTFPMVISRGQKDIKTQSVWRPVMFHGISMEYSTRNSIESPWSFHGFVHVEFHGKSSMEFPWKIYHGKFSMEFYGV